MADDAGTTGDDKGGADDGKGAGASGAAADDTTDYKAEAERLKAEKRSLEANNKRLAKERDDLKAAGMTADEKALNDAKNEGKAEGIKAAGAKLARAEVKAALAGLIDPADMADIIEDIDLSKYVKDDGDVDEDAVKALRTKWEKLTGKKPGEAGNGVRMVQGAGNGVKSTASGEDFIRGLARQKG